MCRHLLSPALGVLGLVVACGRGLEGTATAGAAGGGETPQAGMSAADAAAGMGARGAAGSTSAAQPDAGPSEASGTPTPTSPLFPANGAENVCVDAPLRLRFPGPPRVGSAGKIRVFDAAAPGSPVATVDFAAMTVSETIGGTSFKLPRPVHVDADTVIVRLPAGSLDYGKRYYVTVDMGVIQRPDGSAFAITSDRDWTFATALAAPKQLAQLRVAADGSGDFCSVQAALDALPVRNETASVIAIEPGTYFEIIHAAQKNNVTLRGADRKRTIIAGVNNANLNPSTKTRSLVGIDDSRGFVIEDLTIKNLTPQGGSQAEALRLEKCEQCIVRRADLSSLQDTVLWSGTIYAADSYIAGNVDFVWGTGAAFFERCEIRTVGRAGYIVQARNTAGGSGYVFVDSKITADAGISGVVLARIDAGEYPASQVAYINCQMGKHIAPGGWLITAGAPSAALRFWEYQSTDAGGVTLDVSKRIAGSKQLSEAEATRLRDPAQVLGGWTPDGA